MSRVLVVATMLLVGCDKPVPKVPEFCDMEGMAPWILDCVEKANPHADQEPEDNVAQCEVAAIHLFCGAGCLKNVNGTIVCYSPKGSLS